METDPAERFERAIREDGRYPPAAYEFLHRGLERTARTVHDEPEPGVPHHVSGQQLCESLRVLALESWGPLAQAVLASWNIRTTRDFGEIVFLLIRLGLMGKQDSDRIEDFDNVYNFHEALGAYEIPLDNLEQQQ
ncbi:MAG: hypothetical protein KKI02_12285 [Planctomycetes bacterium]|nr:hypothetical protein [Planctomycetota bacterium]